MHCPINHVKTRSLLYKFGILHQWSHIIDGLQHGFDIGISGQPTNTLIFPNHNSSKLDPDFISNYIEGEVKAGRYSTAFSPADLESIIGPFRTSPIGLVPKPGSTKLRMIQDLSYPRNDPHTPSVNSLIDASQFPTAWGSFVNTSQMILSLPQGCELASFDISSAYRLTPILPAQQNWTCVAWNDKVWVDHAVMFGMASSAGVFGAVADMLVALYNAAGFGPISKWVDDFLVARLPGQSWTEEEFIGLTADLGVPWNEAKLRKFAKVQRYIGFDWWVDEKAVGFPTEKLSKTLALLDTWLIDGARFSGKEAAALHGKLVHVSTIYPLLRPFLPPIASFAGRFSSQRAHLFPTRSVTRSLRRFVSLLPLLPTVLPLRKPLPRDVNWWGDASTSFGVGVVVGSHWAAWRWAPGVKVGPRQSRDIGWAEAVAVELGLRMVVKLGLNLPGALLVRSDNDGVVTVVNKGRSRNAATNTILQHIYTILAENGMDLHASYVSTHENISDALSRGDVEHFLKSCSSPMSHLTITLPPHLSPLLRPL